MSTCAYPKCRSWGSKWDIGGELCSQKVLVHCRGTSSTLVHRQPAYMPIVLDRAGCYAVAPSSAVTCSAPPHLWGLWVYMVWLARTARQPDHIPLSTRRRGLSGGCPLGGGEVEWERGPATDRTGHCVRRLAMMPAPLSSSPRTVRALSTGRPPVFGRAVGARTSTK